MSGRPWPLATLAIVALIGVGCSDGSAQKDSDSNTGGKNAAARGKAAKYAECMRENGVSEFPDPDASGSLTIDGVVNGSSLDTSAPAWKAAMGACKNLEPPGYTGDKDVSAGEQKMRLKFAKCIRENGVKDFPDPAKGEPLVDTRRIPSAGGNGGMSVLNAAMRKCRDLGPNTAGP